MFGMRWELPGQSARAHGAANPCGNLQRCQLRDNYDGKASRLTVVLDLLVVSDSHLVGCRLSSDGCRKVVGVVK